MTSYDLKMSLGVKNRPQVFKIYRNVFNDSKERAGC